MTFECGESGRPFTAKDCELVTSTWPGSATLEGEIYEPEMTVKDGKGKEECVQPETIDYHVRTVKWRPVGDNQ